MTMVGISRVDQMRVDLHKQVAGLSNRLATTYARDELLKRLQQIIEGLPLATDDYTLARQRMVNARRYLAAHQFGPARWELNMLGRGIRAALHTADPRRTVP